MRSWTSTFGLIFAATLAASHLTCGISPKPEPPIRIGSIPHLDLGEITAEEASNGPDAGMDGPGVHGDPGAADPPGAVVRVFNLDQNIPVEQGVVAEDGSFDVPIFLAPGDEIRLQVIDGPARSEPVDFLVSAVYGPPEPSVRALRDCLFLTPPTDLVLDGSVLVENQCGQPVQLELPAPRIPVPGLEVGQGLTWPLLLDNAASVTIPMTYQGGAALEEVVLIEATSPQRDRRPITVHTE